MSAVYFIRPIGMKGPIKIGCSVSPDRRRSTLETWSPFPLEIVAEIDGSFELERRFHALFAEWHQGREWFLWTVRLQQVIDAINAGIFDLDSLPDPKCLKPMRRRTNGWTERGKRIQSYAARIRHIETKRQRFLPPHLNGWRGFFDDAAQMRPVEAFLADPVAHGISGEARRQEKIAHLRTLGTDWSRKLIAQLEAA